jgi:YidC/Oxa1 family membrane protein insertase
MSSVRHAIGGVFQPLFHFFGWILAFFYGLIPNYVFAIAALTVVIMGVLTPLTVKSTKSMIAMNRLQPEIKKLQQKYKGPENRQLLNDELMALYREAGANPLGGCLPMLLQAPFLFILYSVIKGLANKVLVNGVAVAKPRYIPTDSKIYHALIASNGAIKAFGMDLSLKVFSSGFSLVSRLPFFAFVAVAVFLQYLQMSQVNRRALTSGQQIPSQQLMMQRFMPIFFAYFYIVIPAAVVLYMIISTIIRIITQDVMFRTGVSDPRRAGAKPAVREVPGVAKAEGEPSTLKSDQNRSKTKRKRKNR